MTHQALSLKTGLSPRGLWGIENNKGGYGPTLITIAKIAQALEIDTAEFFRKESSIEDILGGKK